MIEIIESLDVLPSFVLAAILGAGFAVSLLSQLRLHRAARTLSATAAPGVLSRVSQAALSITILLTAALMAKFSSIGKVSFMIFVCFGAIATLVFLGTRQRKGRADGR